LLFCTEKIEAYPVAIDGHYLLFISDLLVFGVLNINSNNGGRINWHADAQYHQAYTSESSFFEHIILIQTSYLFQYQVLIDHSGFWCLPDFHLFPMRVIDSHSSTDTLILSGNGNQFSSGILLVFSATI
jgi:hypothetical protein